MATADSGEPIGVLIREAASRRHLYAAVDEDGVRSNRNEGYLALVEGHAAPALRRLVADPQGVTPPERATIAWFIAFQTMRTPSAAAQVTAAANLGLQLAVSELASDRQAFAQRHRQFHDRHATDAEIERFRLELLDQVRAGKVRLNGEGGAAFGAGLEHAAELIPAIYAFDWVLVRAPDGGLITSDRAHSIEDPTPPFPWTAQAPLSSPRSTTFVPLSDSVGLLLTPGTGRSRLEVAGATPAEVERLNLLTYGWADAHLFAASADALLRVRELAAGAPTEVPRPRPHCQVVLLEPDPDDSSLADENEQRGWPAQLPGSDGRAWDYIVIPMDRPSPKLRQRADDVAERPALKRAGVQSPLHADGRLVHRAVHALDLTPE